MEINSKDELLSLLADLQGEMANMRETVDKLSPVEDEADPAEDEPKEDDPKEEPSEEEVNEIDKLLQES